MRYKHILSMAWFITVACIVIRTLQLIFTIDQSNGFYIKEYEYIGFFMTSAILIGIGVLAVITATVRRNPNCLPKTSILLGIVSVAMGLAVIFDIFNARKAINVPHWQIVLLYALGLAAAIFFFAFGISAVAHYKLPGLLFATPTLFYISKIVCSFVTISRISLTSDSVFVMISDCVTLIFMFEFAKTANHIDTKYIYKKILVSGLCAASLNLICVVPPVISGIITKHSYLKVSLCGAVLYFVSAIFIYTFIIEMFKKENIKVHHSHHKTSKERYDEPETKFYFGDIKSQSENG